MFQKKKKNLQILEQGKKMGKKKKHHNHSPATSILLQDMVETQRLRTPMTLSTKVSAHHIQRDH